jgi:hypothetical protein
VEKLKPKYVYGKEINFKPQYEAPKIPACSETSTIVPYNLTAYKANCHCGAVTYTVYIPSLTDHEVMSCNCSICSLNGYLFVYPLRHEVIFHSGYDHLSTYAFGTKMVSHKFCPTCGSSVMIDCNGYGHAGLDKLSMNVRKVNIWV